MSMFRCWVCGRRPQEDCCKKCHANHDKAWDGKQSLENKHDPTKPLARAILERTK